MMRPLQSSISTSQTSTRRASWSDRASRAARSSGHADQCAKIHDALIEFPCRIPILWNERGGRLVKTPVRFGSLPQFGMKRSTNDTLDVRVDCGHTFLIRKRRDGAGRVGTHARQVAQVVHGRGEFSAVFVNDLFGERVQVGGPAVITKTLPRLSHVMWSSGCQRLHRGEASQEPVVVIDHAVDRRLLQHEFGDQYLVRFTSTTPRQVSPLVAEPLQKPPFEGQSPRGCFSVSTHHGEYDRGGVTGGTTTRLNRIVIPYHVNDFSDEKRVAGSGQQAAAAQRAAN